MNNIPFYNNIRTHLGEDGTRTHKWFGMGGSWCDMFVSKCYYEKAWNLWFGKQSFCPTTIKICRANLAEIPMYLAMPSDVIFFDWDFNGIPNHIGQVKNRVSTDVINTIEGNTGSPARVRERVRPAKYVCGIFRPHFVPKSIDTSKPLTIDGQFDYNSIAMLQKALGIKADAILGKGTVKALQKKVGVNADGAWGKNTSKAVQKMIGATVDGAFGEKSVKALQTWINKQIQFKTDGKTQTSVAKPVEVKPVLKGYDGALPTLPIKVSTERGKALANEAKRIAWALGTPESKYKFKGGNPTSACKVVMNKRGYTSKISLSDCGYFQNSIIYAVLGLKVNVLGAVKAPFKSVDGFKVVHKGTIGAGMLREGDIIRYKKKSGQHTLMYIGDGIIAEAGRKTRFGRRIKSTKYNDSNVKHSTIEILRAIEGTKDKACLSNGDKGDEVKKWQAFLKWAGFDVGTIDGDFGERTLGATKNFQLKVGLTADGIVGSKTIAKAKEYTI